MYEKEITALGEKFVNSDFFNAERHKSKTAVLSVLHRIALSGKLDKKELVILEGLTCCAPPINFLATVAPPMKRTAVWLLPALENLNDEQTADFHVARTFAEAICSEKENLEPTQVSAAIDRLLLLWGFRPVRTEQIAKAGASA